MKKTSKFSALALGLGAFGFLLSIAPPSFAQGANIAKLEIWVQDLKTKGDYANIEHGDVLHLKVGDRVRLRMRAIPRNRHGKPHYPSASFELQNGRGSIVMTGENKERGSAVLEVRRAYSAPAGAAHPFIRFQLLEKMNIEPKLIKGAFSMRVGEKEEAQSSTPPPVVVQPPAAPKPPQPRRGVTLYEHQDFRGTKETFYQDELNLNNNTIRADSASSIRLDPGCRVVVYEHPEFQGNSSTFTRDVRDLNGSRVGNDTASSLHLECNSESSGHSSTDRPQERYGVTLFEHQEYRGRSETFFSDDPSLNDNQIRHDAASSVRVDPGCQVTLFEHPNYQGRSSVLTQDVTDLNGSRVGNDSVSALRIDCRNSSDRYGDNRYRDERSQDGRYGDPRYRDERSSNDQYRDDRYREGTSRNERYRDDRYDRGNRRGVTLFEHQDYRGRSETFFEEDRRLNDNELRHDSASSVRVDEGCRVILYEHPDFDGKATVLTEDVWDLRETRVGNDSVSSLEVRCDSRRSY
ncbi:MAG: hypothetical protein K0U98_10800 [Deltaproteobacteria bacterium]|nr:hypothetical protein [Deltaproteobacteria bacterium]